MVNYGEKPEYKNLVFCENMNPWKYDSLKEKENYSEPIYLVAWNFKDVCSTWSLVLSQALIYNLESLVAEFGGSLGLFLGFSFMTLWDGLAHSRLLVAWIASRWHQRVWSNKTGKYWPEILRTGQKEIVWRIKISHSRNIMQNCPWPNPEYL